MGVLGAATFLAGSSIAAADDTTVGPVTVGEEHSSTDSDEFLYLEWVWDNGDGSQDFVWLLAANDRFGDGFHAATGTCVSAEDCTINDEAEGQLPAGALDVDSAAGTATLDAVVGDCTLDVTMTFSPDDRRPRPGTIPSSAGPAQGQNGPRLVVHHTGSRYANHEGTATGVVCGWGTGTPDQNYAGAFERQTERSTTFVEIDTP